MKIVIFNDTIGELGGAENYYDLLSNLLKTKGHVTYLAGFGKSQEISDSKFIYKETDNTLARYWWRLTFNFRVYFLFKKWLKGINPNVIHLCNINKYTFSVLLACHGYKVVHSVLDFGLLCPSKWGMDKKTMKDCPLRAKSSCFSHRCLPWYQLIPMCVFSNIRKKILNKITSNFICETPVIQKYMQIQSYQNVKHRTLGLDLNSWKYKQKNNFSNKILFVGLFEENKGILLLPEIIKNVIEKLPNLNFQIVGAGSLEKEFKDKITRNNLDKNITFLGRKKLNELEQYYSVADMLVVTSIWMDNAPLVIMQSMACGTPVIAFNRGGIGWQLQSAGILINPFDTNEFSKNIIEMYKNRDNWIEHSVKSRESAQTLFDANKNINKIIELY